MDKVEAINLKHEKALVGGMHADALRRLATSDDRAVAMAEVSALTRGLIEATGRGLVLDEADLSGLDLSGFDLRQAVFNRAILHGTNFASANLSGAMLICPGTERTCFREANLYGTYIHAFAAQVCDFRGANLGAIVDGTGSLFHGCDMEEAVFDHAMLAGSMFYQCSLRSASARCVSLQGCSFVECAADRLVLAGAGLDQVVFNKSSLDHASLAGARGEGVSLVRCTISGGLDLSHAALPALRILRCRIDGLDARSLDASDADFTLCDFTAATFAKARLVRARFSTAGLLGADFTDGHLDGTCFRDCTAKGAVFAFAQLENASFTECNLAGADFSRIRARSMHSRDCNLTGSRFIGAYLYRAVLTGDHPAAHSMKSADFSNAVLVQAYVVGDLSGGSLRGARAAYSRLNQCLLRNVDLTGASLFQSSMVKSDLTGAKLDGVAPPFFPDRCRGLEDSAPQELRSYVTAFSDVLSRYSHKST